MTKRNRHLIALLSAVLLTVCAGRPAKVDLGVDLYLHPDSASPDDVMLQAAIHKRVSQHESLRRDLIHVRVFELNVFLTGTVKDPCARNTAEQIARTTEVTLGGDSGDVTTVRAKRVENHIEGLGGKRCTGG